MRCYVVSITTHRQAYVALCDTGEMTVTKKLKDVPEKFKSIPVLTFQAEVRCICPHEKLRHLVEVDLIILNILLIYFPYVCLKKLHESKC